MSHEEFARIRADLSHALEANALLIAENRRLREAKDLLYAALEKFTVAGVGNSTDYVIQHAAYIKAMQAFGVIAKHGGQS